MAQIERLLILLMIPIMVIACSNSNTGAPVSGNTLVDVSPPVINGTPLVGVSFEATGAAAFYTLTPPTATDASGIASVTVNSSGPFNVGTTAVTWTVTDNVGLISRASQNVVVQDTTPPTISLLGIDPYTIEIGQVYTDSGATASDLVSGNIQVTTTSAVNTAAVGTYTVLYDAVDVYGNAAVQVTRTVIVQDATPPTLAIVTSNTGYTATATDLVDGNVTSSITRIDQWRSGSPVIYYAVQDSYGNSSNLTDQYSVGWQSVKNNLPITTDFHAVAQGAVVTVAVGSGGTIYTSADDYSWVASSSGTLQTLNGIVWGGSQFVVVGNSGTILTSQDGSSWIAEVSPTIKTLYGIVWNGAMYVAVGSFASNGNSAVLTSPDGHRWSLHNAIASQVALLDVAWGGGQFVAVGTGGTVLTSMDGYAWVQQQTFLPSIDLYSVAWSGANFSTVGFDSNFPATYKVLTSSNAQLWTTVFNSVNQSIILRDIQWNGSQFIAVGDQGKILTSTDSLNWTEQINTGTTNALYSVAQRGGRYIVVGRSATIRIGG